MGRTSTAGSAGLARSTASEQALARRHRDTLVLAAATLVASAGHDPDRAPCAAARCGLSDPRTCAVAHDLARLPGAPRVAETVPLPVAVVRFTEALTEAADAIRHCRQTVHPGHGCWFSADGHHERCGEVLRLLHHLG